MHLEVRGKGGGRGGCEVRVHSFALVTQNICLALPHSPGKGSKGRRRERERNGERLKKEKQPKVSPKHLLLSLRMIRRRGRRRNTGDFAVNWEGYINMKPGNIRQQPPVPTYHLQPSTKRCTLKRKTYIHTSSLLLDSLSAVHIHIYIWTYRVLTAREHSVVHGMKEQEISMGEWLYFMHTSINYNI